MCNGSVVTLAGLTIAPTNPDAPLKQSVKPISCSIMVITAYHWSLRSLVLCPSEYLLITHRRALFDD